MTERNEKDPLVQAVTEHILTAEREEIDISDPEICAVTWASTEMLGRMIVSGSLIQRSSYIKDFTGNPIQAIPTQRMSQLLNEMKISNTIRRYLDDPESIKDDTKYAAESTAEVNFFLKQLGLPFDNPQLNTYANEYIDQSYPKNPGILTSSNLLETRAYENLSQLIPQEALPRIHTLAARARTRKGFLVGIKSNAPFMAQDIGFQLVLRFGENGMPYHNMAVITPMGPHEKSWLASLRKKS